MESISLIVPSAIEAEEEGLEACILSTHFDDSDSPTFPETARLNQSLLPCLFPVIGTQTHPLNRRDGAGGKAGGLRLKGLRTCLKSCWK